MAMWRHGLPRVSRQIVLDDVTELIGNITSQTISDIGKKTATVKIGDFEVRGDLKRQQQYMGRSLYQINLPSTEMKTQTPCTISNVMVPDAHDLFSDEWRSHNSILVQFPNSGLSFNVTPAGTFTDFHADKRGMFLNARNLSLSYNLKVSNGPSSGWYGVKATYQFALVNLIAKIHLVVF
ncbi:hypothetical protein ACEPPN_012116 [Leptodophora sp. 'Broadleaf-Isolate-01']